jgi:multicomponent Na+:H+ antiporter subunit D
MTQLLALPVFVPLLTAAVCLLAGGRRRLQRAVGVGGAAALLGVAIALLVAVDREGFLVIQMGDWPAPFGITLVADRFAAAMVVMAGLTGLAVAVYSLAGVDPGREGFGYYPLLHVLLMGVCGAFLTGDLFNLYVWFEVMLMGSFVLLVLGGEPGQLQGGIKYVTLNLVSSAVFLAGVGILYGLAGTLNLADLAVKLGSAPNPGLVTAVGMMFFVAFGVKAALFPLFFWLPASYHTPPAAVSAVFAGLLTKVGVYALIRVFTLVFVREPGFTHGLIVAVSAATMLVGVLGAVAQTDFRRILSFHIISQIGYMTLGLGLAGLAGSPELAGFALAGSVFYIVHHIIVKTNLFLVCGVAERLGETSDLKALGSLYRAYPGLAVLFAIPALSLAGMPPLSGFFAKLAVIRAGLGIGEYAAAAVALGVGLLTLYSMTKIWVEAFWKDAPVPAPPIGGEGAWGGPRWVTAALAGPIAGLAGLTVAIGVFAGPLFAFSARAADQLLDREGYIRAVLGAGP